MSDATILFFSLVAVVGLSLASLAYLVTGMQATTLGTRHVRKHDDR